jgi:hypothetical protein
MSSLVTKHFIRSLFIRLVHGQSWLDVLVDRCLLQSGVVVELVQHIRLLVAVSSEDDIDDDVLDDLDVSCASKSWMTKAYINLPSLIRLDLLGIPYLLICLTCLEVDVVL